MKCSRCLWEGEVEYFTRDGKVYKTCNKCAQYRVENKEYTKTYEKLYRQNNPEKISTKNKNIYIKTINETPYVRCFYTSKQRSRQQNIEFNITLDYLEEIFPTNNICPCFDVEMTHNTIYALSLDRIDPNLGYVIGNVQFISSRANFLKSDAGVMEIEKIIKYIENHNNGVITISDYYQDVEVYIGRRIRELRSRAKKKNIEFNLSKLDVYIPIVCPVLGINITIPGQLNDPGLPSFDRVDPKIGYIPSNVSIISRRANSIKNDGTLEEFTKLLKFMEA